jgi:hypothetical protein
MKIYIFVKYGLMKKLSFQNILLLIVILIFVIWLITGDISFGSQKESNSQEIIAVNLNNLSNITGKLYVSPDNAWLNFYESISSIDTSLKLQTLDFTKK